ncbi:hypothetical protein [Azohydromonas aeria]|uniref:hypothetical protein n=1 Tax=Azohydromonas aeria TaxID=2590212 RepID=UPI0012FB24AB|nr:hypothetical protein [Azohydromonas aeria]
MQSLLTPIAEVVQNLLGPIPDYNQFRSYILPDAQGTLARDDQTRLCYWYLDSLGAMKHGRGVRRDAERMGQMVTATWLLAERGIGAEYLPLVEEAKDALRRLKERVERMEAARRPVSWVLDGPGYQALLSCTDLHEAQLEHEDCTQATLAWLIQEAELRLRLGHITWITRGLG